MLSYIPEGGETMWTPGQGDLGFRERKGTCERERKFNWKRLEKRLYKQLNALASLGRKPEKKRHILFFS